MTDKRYSFTLGLHNEFKDIVDHCRQDKHISVFELMKQVNEQDKEFKKLKRENKQLKRELNELHEQIQDLMKYKYLVKALEEVSGSHYIDEIISDWTDGDLFDTDEQIKLGKQVVEKGLSWEEVE